jgi:uncharacterized Zn finger protein (UPF0148 family)
MFKNIIAPMQAWLLSQGKCVGCGKPLARKNGKVVCVCGRIYMYDAGSARFRRATLDEIK